MQQINGSMTGRLWDDHQKAPYFSYKVCRLYLNIYAILVDFWMCLQFQNNHQADGRNACKERIWLLSFSNNPFVCTSVTSNSHFLLLKCVWFLLDGPTKSAICRGLFSPLRPQMDRFIRCGMTIRKAFVLKLTTWEKLAWGASACGTATSWTTVVNRRPGSRPQPCGMHC